MVSEILSNFESGTYVDLVVAILLLCTCFFGEFLSDYFLNKRLRKMDEKYTFINEIFKNYIAATSEPEEQKEDIKSE